MDANIRHEKSMSASNTNGDAPDNVVRLDTAPPGDQFTTKAGVELEERRKVLFRAFELTGKQLEHDAGKMVQSSILGEHEVKHRIELMDKARCLYVSVA